VSGYRTIDLPPVDIAEGRISGVGRYVDSFGNIISNVSASHLKEAFGDTPLAKVHGTVNTNIGIDGIDGFFSEGAKGGVILILNSWGLVEISVNQGSAAGLSPGEATSTVIELTLGGSKP
jgi:S-adenosylmethionine hydrolase